MFLLMVQWYHLKNGSEVPRVHGPFYTNGQNSLKLGIMLTVAVALTGEPLVVQVRV